VTAGWTFLTNHAHVLICLSRNPDARLREVAEEVGITERAVQRIVRELEEEGYLERRRVGRRNTYTVHTDLPMRHPVEQPRTVGEILKNLVD
jgi:DNA-binding MarR family transcriptional regulator